MKCPQCGEETRQGDRCERCGKALSSKEMEVEYKEFRVSELLDIKMIRKGGGGQAEKKDEKPEPSHRKVSRQPGGIGSGPKSREKRTFLTIVTVIAVVIAAVAGIYLIRHLLQAF